MRWILDSCTLIYLVKLKLFNRFKEIAKYPIVIDSSVYTEVVVDGKNRNYPDAFDAEKILNDTQIPIIALDVSKDINLFIDPGETSCYMLGKSEGICITSDDRAFKKMIKQNIKTVRLDTFFFEKYCQNQISEKEFMQILNLLKNIDATKTQSILFFLEQIEKKIKEKNANE